MRKLGNWWSESKPTPKQLEAVGVAILGLAAFWEIIALRQVIEFVQEAQFQELAHKLGQIWMAVGSSNPSDFVRSYQPTFESHNVIDRLDEYRSKFTYEGPKTVRNTCYVVGTYLVVLGKWFDGVRKPKT